jgi:hypothetical protein
MNEKVVPRQWLVPITTSLRSPFPETLYRRQIEMTAAKSSLLLFDLLRCVKD